MSKATMEIELPSGCFSGTMEGRGGWSTCDCGWGSGSMRSEMEARLRLMLHRENLTYMKHPIGIARKELSPDDSILDGMELWHNGCGGFAGRTKEEAILHIRDCYSKGLTVHAHEFNGTEPETGATATFAFRRSVLEVPA